MTVVPAYGRDYKSKADALQDWHNGKDFRDAVSGRYLSRLDNVPDVWIRYDNQRKIIKAE